MTRDSYEKGKGALETRDRYGKDIEKVRDKISLALTQARFRHRFPNKNEMLMELN